MMYFYLSVVQLGNAPTEDKFLGGTIIKAKDAEEAVKAVYDQGIVQRQGSIEIFTAEMNYGLDQMTPEMKAYIGRLVPAEEILAKDHLTLREALAMSEGKPN